MLRGAGYWAAPQHDIVSEDEVQGKRILLIVGGGIAAYKSLDLVRRLKERGAKCARS